STESGVESIVGARELESSIKEIVAETESKIEDDQVVFNLNSGSHAGFNLHEILISVDQEEMDEKFEMIFGEKITVLLGVNDSQVYVGVGKNPEATLKKSIDANAAGAKSPEPIGQYNIFITPIMEMMTQIDAEQEMFEILRDKIAEAGKDRVRISYDVVDGVFKIRAEMQDGIFQLMGVAAESMQGMGGGADF
ncbi:MAG: hypothetical protein AAGA30_06515, partial [Planctomycetota bacterium]